MTSSVTISQSGLCDDQRLHYGVQESLPGRSLEEGAIKAKHTWSGLPDAFCSSHSDTYLFAPCPQSDSKEDNSSQLSRGGVEGWGEVGKEGERERVSYV